MTELVRGPADVRRRTGSEKVSTTVEWRRRIGGQRGAQVVLPAGAISDDTQLRLAVGRCIRSTGRFDVEAFTRVELPTFMAYELGAGRGTKAAARAYTKRATRYYNNVWEDHGQKYVDGGGNGAAMRIQPHVWAAPGHHPNEFTASVLVDAISTHGHPHGFLGALYHALCLADVMRQQRLPDYERAQELARYLLRAPDILRDNELVREHWWPRWERQAGRPLIEAIQETVAETHEALARANEPRSLTGAETYPEILRALGGLEPRTRGSGMLSAVLALTLARQYDTAPADGLRLAANQLGSDTDTIATMAGALLGPLTQDTPPGPVQDAEYILLQARRLEAVGRRRETDNFAHPDALKWSPPRRQVDVVVQVEGEQFEGEHFAVGLGRIQPASELYRGPDDDVVWQWYATQYGQTLLLKRRTEPEIKSLADVQPIRSPQRPTPPTPPTPRPTRPPGERPSVTEALREARESEYDDAVVGSLMKLLGTEAPYFATMVVQAIERGNTGRALYERVRI